ncbi:hypothetical protein SD71_07890 [Cohnella kolymensis]|uniref:Lipoprotein n=1 Tax=Cohnella kolymensis TaxID=1590652 RepID=A0ABR5A5P4_9BACL|nr:PCYCGC motif-containing (lipo)protein [Cohnella kolymensis]KIL36390.1 hypothetical protein SD71_07890 [Cohnella kolymensis]
MHKIFYPLMAAALFILSSCGSNDTQQNAHVHHAPNGDLQEETASLEKLPSFLDHLSPEVVTAYTAAGKLKDTLQWIPCFCGCGESAGHKSNLNCFINSVREDGSVVWDDHGTRCGVCLEIAITAAQLKQQGASTLEIRQLIDRQYSSGYGNPTVTPMPNA